MRKKCRKGPSLRQSKTISNEWGLDKFEASGENASSLRNLEDVDE